VNPPAPAAPSKLKYQRTPRCRHRANRHKRLVEYALARTGNAINQSSISILELAQNEREAEDEFRFHGFLIVQ
jgi:ribosomal protein S30